MLLSQYFIPTLKEIPAEAVITSHQLMLRAGLIRKVSSGLYTYLPLGYRALLKVAAIVREEMNNAGALECSIPLLVPVELWQESGRWNPDKAELMRLMDRHKHQMILSPTNEENFTDIFRNEIQSYRELPINLYQIGTKFRDEIRPRFGVMRSKEFLMKDAYSFDLDEAGLDVVYHKMQQAYYTIFNRCCLKTVSVKADSGDIGGDVSEEFMVESQVGEEEIISCPCGYVANVETADARISPIEQSTADLPIEEVHTPNFKTIEDLTGFFKTEPSNFIKSIIYLADEEPILVMIRGDLEINEVKLKNLCGATNLELAPAAVVEDVTGANVGFAGALGLKQAVKIYADDSVKSLTDAITGANKTDTHFIHIAPERDFPTGVAYGNLYRVNGSHHCIQCGKPLQIYRGIEVGHIFKLGDKYTKAMNVTVMDPNGKAITPLMGCYGIGVTRTLAAVIEQNCDKDGIIWPFSMAPFHLIILPLNSKNEQARELARQIEQAVEKSGFEALVDDRDISPGVKFKDADLIGIPWRINLGDRCLKNNQVELVRRQDHQITLLPIDTAIESIIEALKSCQAV